MPTTDAVIPAGVGVDIGCGMCAVRTELHADDLPEDLAPLRAAIERAVPHGRTHNGGPGDRGAWAHLPERHAAAWDAELAEEFAAIVDWRPAIGRSNNRNHLGTLGTGNHFIEVCLDEDGRVWVMLHSGSRGVGGRTGSLFVKEAKFPAKCWYIDLPHPALAYLPEVTEPFKAYMRSAAWAQRFARTNRQLMLESTLEALASVLGSFKLAGERVDCHHNYVAREEHFGRQVWVTRKGAVRAGLGEAGIIPGSMGARSYIVEGLGNRDSFSSCSHGAGRAMSRTAARKRFSLEKHRAATAGVECRVDEDVIDETPAAYKPIEAVMAAQDDLVSVRHELRQVVCVKG